MSILSKIQALITAANNATGESDTTLTDAVQTLVDGYGQGGEGGSLPSVISKIDGGSFTLASDTQASRYTISHNLGIVPKQILLWTEDATLRDSYDTLPERYIMWSSYMLLPWVHNATTSYGGVPFYIYRNTTGSSGNTGSPSQSTSSVTSSDFSFVSSMFYKAGLTYKWLAWA